MMSKNKLILISFLIPVILIIIYILTGLTSNLFNFFIVFLIPLIIIFSIIWTIILLFKVKTLRLIIIPLIIVTLIPLIDLIFGLRFKLVESFKPELLIKAKTEGPVSSIELYLRETNSFEFNEGSLFGSKNYVGDFVINEDTLILNFQNNKPDIIDNYQSKWRIDKDNEKIYCLSTGFTLEIKKINK